MAGGTLVRELAAGALVDATFAVSRKERRTRRDGRPFLDLELTDKSGRVRPACGTACRCSSRFEVGDSVRVLARVSEYDGGVELELRDVEKVEAGDPLELVPGARRDTEDLDGYVDFLVGEMNHAGLGRCARRSSTSRGTASGCAPPPPRRPDTTPTPAGCGAHGGGRRALPRDGAAAPTARCRPAHGGRPAARLRLRGRVRDGPVIRPSERGALLGHVRLGLAADRAPGRQRIAARPLNGSLGMRRLASRRPEGRRFPSPEAVALHAANALDSRVNDAL